MCIRDRYRNPGSRQGPADAGQRDRRCRRAFAPLGTRRRGVSSVRGVPAADWAEDSGLRRRAYLEAEFSKIRGHWSHDIQRAEPYRPGAVGPSSTEIVEGNRWRRSLPGDSTTENWGCDAGRLTQAWSQLVTLTTLIETPQT